MPPKLTLLGSVSTPRQQASPSPLPNPNQFKAVQKEILEYNWRTGRYRETVVDVRSNIDLSESSKIYCICFDANTLAAGCSDNSIRIWNMNDLNYCGKLEAHTGSVLCLQLDSKRDIIVSGSSDSSIIIWNMRTKTVSQTLIGHLKHVASLHFHEKLLISGSHDTTARIWTLQETSSVERLSTMTSAESGDPELIPHFVSFSVLKGHDCAVNSVHSDGIYAVTASGDGTIGIWEVETGLLLRRIRAHTRGIATINITGRLVVTGSHDNSIKIFDLQKGTELKTLVDHTDMVRTLYIRNEIIISGGYDKSIRFWNLKTGNILKVYSACHNSRYMIYICVG